MQVTRVVSQSPCTRATTDPSLTKTWVKTVTGCAFALRRKREGVGPANPTRRPTIHREDVPVVGGGGGGGVGGGVGGAAVGVVTASTVAPFWLRRRTKLNE